MNPIALAMMGLAFGLWLNAFNLLGIGAKPAKEGAVSPTKTVATAGSLIAASALIFGAVWMVVGVPFGPEAGPIQALFAATMGMYGFLFIGVFAVQNFNLDGRPVGSACLMLAILQVIIIIGLATITGMATVHDWMVAIVLATYAVLLLLFWGLFYGKVSASPTGWWALVTWVGTLYLLFFGGGIFPAP